jgi:hypothetical protein
VFAKSPATVSSGESAPPGSELQLRDIAHHLPEGVSGVLLSGRQKKCSWHPFPPLAGHAPFSGKLNSAVWGVSLFPAAGGGAGPPPLHCVACGEGYRIQGLTLNLWGCGNVPLRVIKLQADFGGLPGWLVMGSLRWECKGRDGQLSGEGQRSGSGSGSGPWQVA